MFFWDPLVSAQLQPLQELPPALNRGAYRPRRSPQEEQARDMYIKENLPAIGTNHYKGDKVFANFGYYPIDGNWADPDSEGELNDIYKNGISSQSLPHTGPPRDDIMTPEEQDTMYRDFVEEVTDEEDGEGDPRLWRISGATFLQWATGAAVGDRFEEKPMKTPVSSEK